MAFVLDHRRAALLNRIAQFPTPIMAVDTPTDLVTGIEIGGSSQPHRISRELEGQRCTGYFRDQIAHGKAELGIRAQGAEMIRRMDESHRDTAGMDIGAGTIVVTVPPKVACRDMIRNGTGANSLVALLDSDPHLVSGHGHQTPVTCLNRF